MINKYDRRGYRPNSGAQKALLWVIVAVVVWAMFIYLIIKI